MWVTFLHRYSIKGRVKEVNGNDWLNVPVDLGAQSIHGIRMISMDIPYTIWNVVFEGPEPLSTVQVMINCASVRYAGNLGWSPGCIYPGVPPFVYQRWVDFRQVKVSYKFTNCHFADQASLHKIKVQSWKFIIAFQCIIPHSMANFYLIFETF